MSEGTVTGETRLLALIADPVANAKSPRLVNDLLAKRGLFGSYVLVPFAVPKPALSSTVAGLRLCKNFCGAIISMPHKSTIVPLLDETSAETALTFAANVIRREPDGRLVGTCLDGEGMVSGLSSKGHAVSGKSCLLLGAGGAASAIAFALARHGCASLWIENRTVDRARALAAKVHEAFPRCNVQCSPGAIGSVDLMINATSLGMNEGDPLPISANRLEDVGLVAECVVAQAETPLLRAARTLGCAVQPGLPMLEAQIELMVDFMGVPSTTANAHSKRVSPGDVTTER